MVTVPVATGARLLGIHPKTLRHWLITAHHGSSALGSPPNRCTHQMCGPRKSSGNGEPA